MWAAFGYAFGVEGTRFMPQERKTAVIDGDILIGALVSVHHHPERKSGILLKCGKIREQYGIQRIEAAFFAIDQINRDPNILRNVTLGIEVRDSCWNPSIALEQSIEFIRHAITGPSDSAETAKECILEDGVTATPVLGSSSVKNLVGVVGPGSSAVTIQVQNLLQLFHIPQVGYSATSKDLSDKNRFSYFLRVVPSDYHQARVIADLVNEYKWNYVSVVHTDGNYGQSGMAAFKEVADEHNICIAKEDTVLSNAEEKDFDEVIIRLSNDTRATVVVCFCEGLTITNLLKATVRLNKVRRFQFIGSDGWADRSDVVQTSLEEAALGSLTIKIQSPLVDDFDRYYFALRPETNQRNPWFKEFWQHRFKCKFLDEIPKEENFVDNASSNSTNPRICSGEENLREGYNPDTKMGFVVKAVYTMAWGLHNMHLDLCRGEPGPCKAMNPVNGSLLREYLMNVTFSYMGETVSFDSRGDPPGRYDIMNYRRQSDGSFSYVKVAMWDNGSLTFENEKVLFNDSDTMAPVSVCSMECGLGQFKTFIGEKQEKCCWACNDCPVDSYLMNETHCFKCGNGTKPNRNKSGCERLPIEFVDWTDHESIGAFCVAGFGFLSALFVMLVFVLYNDTPVVKASTRELSYIIFTGMMISFLSSLPLLQEPTVPSCALARIMPGFSFSMIYAALVTKTNRIARILAGNKKIIITKLRFMSATAQVVITGLLISIELAIIFFMLLYQPPKVIENYDRPDRTILMCNTTPLGIIAPLGWVFFLILLCTIYAVKTRNLPENFNEAKFIGFAMYTTCVIWLAWVSIYFGSDHKVVSLSLCTSLSALVTLVLLFFPKVYIILCRPERNDRSAFTTTTIRCHIGTSIKQRKLERDKNVLPLVQSPSCVMCTDRSRDQSRWSAILLHMRSSSWSAKQNQRIIRSKSREISDDVKPRSHDINDDIKLRTRDISDDIRPKSHDISDDFRPSSDNISRRRLEVRDIKETCDWSVCTSTTTAFDQRSSTAPKTSDSNLNFEEEKSQTRFEKSCQTCDALLDPLIPRLRRRVVKSVQEGTLSRQEKDEFFQTTQAIMVLKDEFRDEYV